MSEKDQETLENTPEVAETGQKREKPSLFGAFKRVSESQESRGVVDAIPVATMSLPELLDLRARVDRYLPPRSLAEIDLEEELLLQFARTKSLYDTVVEDSETPANQRAQVANSCTAILEQLIKMQTKLYGAERVKALEQVLVKVMKTLPETTQREFFDRYERALEEITALAKERK